MANMQVTAWKIWMPQHGTYACYCKTSMYEVANAAYYAIAVNYLFKFFTKSTLFTTLSFLVLLNWPSKLECLPMMNLSSQL